MSRFGPASTTAGGTLVVWLHGDVSSGGPATYHVALAERAARDDASARTVAVALVRPGYPAGEGRESSGNANARNDHYTAANVAEVVAALERLKTGTGAARLVVAGHSGGAATAAIAAGMRPGLIDAMLLAACPCDIVAWRQGRRAWTRSENPIAWAATVAPPDPRGRADRHARRQHAAGARQRLRRCAEGARRERDVRRCRRRDA